MRRAPVTSSWQSLPRHTTSLVPREAEVSRILASLTREDIRLVTLVGPPGAGKTRLATTASERLLERFSDGIVFVDLALIDDPTFVTGAIAQALGLSDTGERALLPSLKAVIGDRQLLLVLDNFEHVLNSAAAVTELVEACRGLKVLATSRAALHVSYEHQILVLPLALPDLERLPSHDMLAEVPSVKLFCLRAEAVDANWTLNAGNAQAVAEICVRLDGLPLAIELAAGLMRILRPQSLLPRLSDLLDVLVDGDQDQPARHQNLRAAIGWSYDLLSADEQSVYRQLSVFVGGWTVRTAGRLCGRNELAMLQVLRHLVDKNLISTSEQLDGEPRFGMLETIRAFSANRLEEAGGTDEARKRHAVVFVEFAEEAGQQLIGPDQPGWLDRVEQEFGNIRAALQWCSGDLDVGDGAEVGLRIAGALWFFWDMRGHLREGREWLTRILLAPKAQQPSSARAIALHGAAWLAFTQGEYELAASIQQESAQVAADAQDHRARARALSFLGVSLQVGGGDFDAGVALHEEVLPTIVAFDDPWSLSVVFYGLGHVACTRGDLTRMTTWWEQGLALSNRVGNLWGLGFLELRWGLVALQSGQHDRAAGHLQESLRIGRKLTNARGMALAMETLACLNVVEGRPVRAALLFGAADRLLHLAGYNLPRYSQAEHERCIRMATLQLGADQFAQACEQGRQIPMDLAIESALADHVPDSQVESLAGCARELSRREVEIAVQVGRGLTNRRIATNLGIAERTVDTHVEHILRKLGVYARTQIAAWAVARGLLVQPNASDRALSAAAVRRAENRATHPSTRSSISPQ